MSQFTDFAKTALARGSVPDGISDSAYPFIHEDGSLYVRFDRISSENHPGGTMVTYSWGGRDVCKNLIEGMELMASHCTMVLSGFEGRMRVTTTT